MVNRNKNFRQIFGVFERVFVLHDRKLETTTRILLIFYAPLQGPSQDLTTFVWLKYGEGDCDCSMLKYNEYNNIHEKFLHSDGLRTVQFQGNTVQKKGNTVICNELPFFWQCITVFMYIINW